MQAPFACPDLCQPNRSLNLGRMRLARLVETETTKWLMGRENKKPGHLPSPQNNGRVLTQTENLSKWRECDATPLFWLSVNPLLLFGVESS
jgi:hypothetical protein